ncbi:MAG: DUF2892 domain-containing protein [Cycloclasticus sp.]
MNANVGGIDKTLRIVVGLTVILGGILTDHYLIAVIGIVPVATALINWCPAYVPFGINSAK